jgi:hypothetical protein
MATMSLRILLPLSTTLLCLPLVMVTPVVAMMEHVSSVVNKGEFLLLPNINSSSFPKSKELY